MEGKPPSYDLPNAVGGQLSDEQLMDTIITEDMTAPTNLVPPTPSGPSPTKRVGQPRSILRQPVEPASPRSTSSGPSGLLWEAWQTVDADGSGKVTRTEFQAIHSALNIPKDAIAEAWLEAVCHLEGRSSRGMKLGDIRSIVDVQRSECNYAAFIHAYNTVREKQRRGERQSVRSSFLSRQRSPDGMNKHDLGKFVKRMQRRLMLLPPAFDLEKEWNTIVGMTRQFADESPGAEEQATDIAEEQATGLSRLSLKKRKSKRYVGNGKLTFDVDARQTEAARKKALVSFPEFEKWWKFRMGLSETRQQVVPEFLDYKLDELDVLVGAADLEEAAIEQTSARSPSLKPMKPRRKFRIGVLKLMKKRTGLELWEAVKPKVRLMGNVQKAWGSLDNRGSEDSTILVAPSPWYLLQRVFSWSQFNFVLRFCTFRPPLIIDLCRSRYIRNPDSNFSVVWDVSSVVLLLYVSATVPIRACFPDNIPGNMEHREVLSASWTLNTVTDIYFIIDVFLNFFTALPNKYDGTPITDRKIIANSYLKGWFAIDLASSLPIEYIEMLVSGPGGGGVLDLQFLKTLRLLRLAKMLRLARLKRILQKYENLSRVQEYGGFAMLFVAIATAAHLLTCMWYLVGDNEEVLQGNERLGWVHQEWSPANDTTVTLSVRYYTALYSVFNLLDRGSETQGERRFAVFGNLVLIMFDGAVAGVMSAMMIAMQGNEREYNDRIHTARQWLKEQRIPKFRSDAALDYFRTFYKSNVAMQEKEVLGCMTPAMRMEFCSFLYAKFVATVPLFHGLSPGIIRALCTHIEPIFAVKGQVVYGEGTTGRELYIVIAGELEISVGGERLGFISDGGFFGETPILEDTAHAEIRRRTVTAVTTCRLCFLHAEKVNQVKSKYPELGMRLLRCRVRNRNKKGGKLADIASHSGVDTKSTTETRQGFAGDKQAASVPSLPTSQMDAPVDEGRAAAEPTIEMTASTIDSSLRQELTTLNNKVDLMAKQQESILKALARIETTGGGGSDVKFFRPP